MTPLSAIVTTIGVCAGAGALEGALAGPGVRNRLREVRTPRCAPPFGVWIVIGAAYYAMSGAILYRLLRLGFWTFDRVLAVLLVALILLINASWNYFFFRRRNLRQAFLVNIPYVLVASGLAIVLFRLDRVGGWLLVPYLIYLVYAVWLGYAMWRLHESDRNT